jgi:adenylate kinase
MENNNLSSGCELYWSNKKYSRILLVGIPGSGRHFLLSKIKEIVEPKGIMCCSYSALLLEELKKVINAEVSLDDLRNIEYRTISNAKMSVNKRLSETKIWVLSSNICYKQDKNYLFSVDAIRELGIDLIVHISSSPSEILFRRMSSKEKLYDNSESEEEIAFHQSVSEYISKLMADLIDCDCLFIKNLDNNIDKNLEILQKIIGGPNNES